MKIKILIMTIILLTIYAYLPAICRCEESFITEASWYSRASCAREGTSGIMANGKELRDDEYIVASWDYPFGTRLKISSVETGRSIVCVVSDRGPAKRLYRLGRKLDLSKGAFSKLASLKQGTLKVRVCRI